MNEKTKQHWNDWSDQYYESLYHDSTLDTIQQDFMRALLATGFEICDLAEFHPQPDDYDDWWYKSQEEKQKDNYAKFDWRKNPWAALPQWIGACARKKIKSA